MSDRLEHPDLEHADSVDFDWSVRLQKRDLSEDPEAAFAEALGVLLRWLGEPIVGPSYLHTAPAKRTSLAGRRVAVALWIVSPDEFPGVTLQNVAADLRVKPERLHELSAEFSRRFGVKNRLQISRAPSVAARQKRLAA